MRSRGFKGCEASRGWWIVSSAGKILRKVERASPVFCKDLIRLELSDGGVQKM